MAEDNVPLLTSATTPLLLLLLLQDLTLMYPGNLPPPPWMPQRMASAPQQQLLPLQKHLPLYPLRSHAALY